MNWVFIIFFIFPGSLYAKPFEISFWPLSKSLEGLRYCLGGGKSFDPTAAEVRTQNFDIVPASPACNNCFFHALNLAGIEVERTTLLHNLYERASQTTNPLDLSWVLLQSEIAASISVGEYRAPEGQNYLGVARHYLFDHLSRRLDSDGVYPMIGFSLDEPGLIDLIADELRIEIQIYEIDSRTHRSMLLRQTIPLSENSHFPTVRLAYNRTRQHFDWLRQIEAPLPRNTQELFSHEEPSQDLSKALSLKPDSIREALSELLPHLINPYDRRWMALWQEVAYQIQERTLPFDRQPSYPYEAVQHFIEWLPLRNVQPYNLGILDLIADLANLSIDIYRPHENGSAYTLIRHTTSLTQRPENAPNELVLLSYHPTDHTYQVLLTRSEWIHQKLEQVSEIHVPEGFWDTEQSIEVYNGLLALFEGTLRYCYDRYQQSSKSAYSLQRVLSAVRAEKDANHTSAQIQYDFAVMCYWFCYTAQSELGIQPEASPMDDLILFIRENFSLPRYLIEHTFTGNSFQRRELVDWARTFSRNNRTNHRAIFLRDLEIIDSSDPLEKGHFLALSCLQSRKAIIDQFYPKKERSETTPDLLNEHRAYLERIRAERQKKQSKSRNQRADQPNQKPELAHQDDSFAQELRKQQRSETNQQRIERQQFLEERKMAQEIFKTAILFHIAQRTRRAQERQAQSISTAPFDATLLHETSPNWPAIYEEIHRIGGQVFLNAQGNNRHMFQWTGTNGETVIHFFDSIHGSQREKGNKAAAIVGLKKRLMESGLI
ncbi:MAG: hypothetical protein I8H75_01980 [Myxococcaceae bacterium]|nr:hypothetical protein [Myxococcaceae bacterium]MBH2006106.1 hypothetical protein [Myxococcaceae bacterium]